MKNSYDQQLYDLLEEIADRYGVTPREYLDSQLQSVTDERAKQLEGIPENIAKELEYATAARKAERDSKKKQAQNEDMERQIAIFREIFPDVKPEDIPSEVWSAVSEGDSLAGAYAIYYCKQLAYGKNAEEANKSAETRAASPAGKGESEPEYTSEMVENMSDKEVAGNLNGILKSLKKWKI